MNEQDRLIWQTLNVKRGDTLPYSGIRSKATRDDFPAMWAKFGYTCGAEIGVAEGKFSLTICKAMPGVRLMCVDPWAAYEQISQDYCDRRYEKAVARLAPYNVQVVRKPSIEAAVEVPEGSLDFVYIDGSHVFDQVMQDIITWAKRVRKGGCIAGHDYFKFYQAGVLTAVNAYTTAHTVNPWYVTREAMPSFLWVKR